MGRRIYIGTASTPAAATVDTAGEGGFWPVTIYPAVSGSTDSVNTANDVVVAQFVLPFRAVVGNISFGVFTLEAGKFAGFGIYSVAGNRLVHSGAVSVASTGTKSASITAVTLEPAIYFFAWTIDGTTAALQAVNTYTNGQHALVSNAVSTRYGIAANPSVAGVLPATLGVITSNTTFLLPTCYMEP